MANKFLPFLPSASVTVSCASPTVALLPPPDGVNLDMTVENTGSAAAVISFGMAGMAAPGMNAPDVFIIPPGDAILLPAGLGKSIATYVGVLPFGLVSLIFTRGRGAAATPTIIPFITTFTNSGLFVPKSSSTMMRFTLIGGSGGGGGGGVGSAASGGGGGGGGAVEQSHVIPVSSFTYPITVTVGAAGLGGAAGANGTAGGASTVIAPGFQALTAGGGGFGALGAAAVGSGGGAGGSFRATGGNASGATGGTAAAGFGGNGGSGTAESGGFSSSFDQGSGSGGGGCNTTTSVAGSSGLS
jgi:hypothetical protein